MTKIFQHDAQEWFIPPSESSSNVSFANEFAPKKIYYLVLQ